MFEAVRDRLESVTYTVFAAESFVCPENIFPVNFSLKSGFTLDLFSHFYVYGD